MSVLIFDYDISSGEFIKKEKITPNLKYIFVSLPDTNYLIYLYIKNSILKIGLSAKKEDFLKVLKEETDLYQRKLILESNKLEYISREDFINLKKKVFKRDFLSLCEIHFYNKKYKYNINSAVFLLEIEELPPIELIFRLKSANSFFKYWRTITKRFKEIEPVLKEHLWARQLFLLYLFRFNKFDKLKSKKYRWIMEETPIFFPDFITITEEKVEGHCRKHPLTKYLGCKMVKEDYISPFNMVCNFSDCLFFAKRRIHRFKIYLNKYANSPNNPKHLYNIFVEKNYKDSEINVARFPFGEINAIIRQFNIPIECFINSRDVIYLINDFEILKNFILQNPKVIPNLLKEINRIPPKKFNQFNLLEIFLKIKEENPNFFDKKQLVDIQKILLKTLIS